MFIIILLVLSNAHIFKHRDGTPTLLEKASTYEVLKAQHKKEQQRHFLCEAANELGKAICKSADWKQDEASHTVHPECTKAVEEFNKISEMIGHESRLEIICEDETAYASLCLSLINDDDLDTCEWAWNHFEVQNEARRNLNCGCFGGEAEVQSKTRGKISMTELKRGEEIADCVGGFTTVWALSHYGAESGIEFTFEDGKTLTLTPNHYVVAGDKNILARDVTVGSIISGKKIVKKSNIRSMAPFNIVTEQPYFLVNGVCATWLIEGREFIFTISPIVNFLTSLNPKAYIHFLAYVFVGLFDLLKITSIPTIISFVFVCILAIICGLLPAFGVYKITQYHAKKMN